jgi:hypothetical protein
MRRVVPLPALVVLVLGACASGSESGSDGDDAEPDARVTSGDVDAADPPPIDAADPRVDAADLDAADIDAMPPPIDAMPIDAPTGGPVDTCAQALDLTAGAMGPSGTTVAGDTTGYADDVRPTGTCTGYLPDGPDAIYSVNASAGQQIMATVTPAGWDISIYVTQTCTLDPACLVGADTGLSGTPETVSHTAATAGTYYIVVDGWNPGVQGAYSLNVRLQ